MGQKHTLTVIEERNYDKFKLMNFNRDVKDIGVQAIIKSLKHKDLRLENPIKVIKNNGHLEVYDGQHTVLACKALGLPVAYIETNMNVEDVPKFNSSRKSWLGADYVKHYASLGHEGSQKIIDFSKMNGLTVAMALNILGISRVKEDNFNVSNEALKVGQSVVYYVRSFCRITEIPMKTTLIRTFRKIASLDGYKHDYLLKRLRKYPNGIEKCVTIEEYLKAIGRFYNYRNARKIRFWDTI